MRPIGVPDHAWEMHDQKPGILWQLKVTLSLDV
jgi:hypothetical protein